MIVGSFLCVAEFGREGDANRYDWICGILIPPNFGLFGLEGVVERVGGALRPVVVSSWTDG